jgi:hypothetical protein
MFNTYFSHLVLHFFSERTFNKKFKKLTNINGNSYQMVVDVFFFPVHSNRGLSHQISSKLIFEVLKENSSTGQHFTNKQNILV